MKILVCAVGALAAALATGCVGGGAPPALGAEALIVPERNAAPAAAAADVAGARASIRVCFSPRLPGGCDPLSAIKQALAGARSTVLVQAYSFTSRPIARALIAARRRGVAVRIILDRKQLRARDARYEIRELQAIAAAGIPEYLDESVRDLAHNKVMIIDDRIVITGSYNFTTSAERYNAENLLVIEDPALAAEYTRNWNYHFRRSAPYFGP